jgi:hypothetical protein
VLNGGYDHTVEFVKANGPWTLFVWMALLFIKTHLKSGRLRMNRDRRAPNTTIGDARFNWESIHVIHCIARAAYSKCVFAPNVLGSVYIISARDDGDEPFDYGDFYDANAVMLRTGDVAILAVLDDTGVARQRCLPLFKKVEPPLGKLQIREMFAHLAYCNMKVAPRPRFYNALDHKTGNLLMGVRCPHAYDDATFVPEDFGGVMYCVCYEPLSYTDKGKDTLQKILTGKLTFLFDGEFVKGAMRP